MMSAKKILASVLLIAVLVACIEAQYKGGYGGYGLRPAYGKGYGYGGYGYGGPGYGYGYGRRPVYMQGNKGGDANLAQSQDAYNVNYGKGDLNNNQRSQTAQSDSQDNSNGPRYGYGKA